MFLPDINFWLALTFEVHAHHVRAKEFFDEPTDLEQYWRNYTNIESASPKLSSDAYLAAFARSADFQLVTFDKGFRQFKDLNYVIL